MTDSKAIYRRFCEEEASLTPFHRPWWLDATCGEDGWDVALVMKGSKVQAALPYQIRRNRGFRVLCQPPLTPYLGPWYGKTGAKLAQDYGRQKDLFLALIDALPPHDRYVQRWDPSVTNWLPFHWRKFEQTTTYTYAIPDLSDTDRVWSDFRDNIRREIRKAKDREGIEIDENGSLEDILRLNALTYGRQGADAPYSGEYVHGISRACAERDCQKLFVARDREGRLHAGLFIIWDAEATYCLVSGGDPELRSSGAMSLCIWEAILFASRVSGRFDFCGSMIEPFERFFRAFGAEQVPAFRVSRTSSGILRRLSALRDIVAAR